MFRDVVAPEREEVKGSWRSMHNEELRALYFSPFVKEDEMGRMCCTHEEKDEHLLFFLEYLKEQDCLVVVGTDRRVILKLAFSEKDGNMWTGFMRLRVGISGRMFRMW